MFVFSFLFFKFWLLLFYDAMLMPYLQRKKGHTEFMDVAKKLIYQNERKEIL